METAAGLLMGLAFGGMAFFSFLFSPLVFVKLPIETAGPFIRQVFPAYFLASLVIFAVAAPLTLSRPGITALLTVMAALGLVSRQILLPRINAIRDRQLAGDVRSKRLFDTLHRASVVINFVQLAAAGWSLFVLLG
jgi:hypothetical protein